MQLVINIALLDYHPMFDLLNIRPKSKERSPPAPQPTSLLWQRLHVMSETSLLAENAPNNSCKQSVLENWHKSYTAKTETTFYQE